MLRKLTFLVFLLVAAVAVGQSPPSPDPIQYVEDTTYSLPVGGCLWSGSTSFVPCSGGVGQYDDTSQAGFQAVLNAFTPGDIITIPSGTVINSTVGNTGPVCSPGSDTGSNRSAEWIVPYKSNPGNKWTYIIATDFYNGSAGMPAGIRTDPEMYPAQQSHLATFVLNTSFSGAFCFPSGSNKIRMEGIEIKCGDRSGGTPEKNGSCNPAVMGIGMGITGNRTLIVTHQPSGKKMVQNVMLQIDPPQPRCTLSPATIPGDGAAHTITGKCQNTNLTHATSPQIMFGSVGMYQEASDIYYGNSNGSSYSITGCSVSGNVATINISGGLVVYDRNVYISGDTGSCSFLNGTRTVLAPVAGSFTTFITHSDLSLVSDTTATTVGLQRNGAITVVDDNTFTVSVTPTLCDAGNTTNLAESWTCGPHFVEVFAKIAQGFGECQITACNIMAYVVEPYQVTGGPESITAICADNPLNTASPGGGHLCDVVNSNVVVGGFSGTSKTGYFNIIGSGTHWATAGYQTDVYYDWGWTSSPHICDTDTHCYIAASIYTVPTAWGYTGPHTVNVVTYPTTLKENNIIRGNQALDLKSYHGLQVVPCQTTACLAAETNCYIQSVTPNHILPGTSGTVAVVQAEAVPGGSNCTNFSTSDTFDFNNNQTGTVLDTTGCGGSGCLAPDKVNQTSVIVGGPACQALGYPSGGGYCADVALSVDANTEVGASEIVFSHMYVHGDYGTIKNCANVGTYNGISSIIFDGTLLNDPNGATSPTCRNLTGAPIVAKSTNQQTPDQGAVIPPGVWFSTNAYELARGFYFNFDRSAIIDSTVSQISKNGQESQGAAWGQTLGRFKFCNNRFEAMGEPTFSGGGWSRAASVITSQDVLYGNGSYGLANFNTNTDATCRGNFTHHPAYMMPLSFVTWSSGTPIPNPVTNLSLTSNVLTITVNNNWYTIGTNGTIGPCSQANFGFTNCPNINLVGSLTSDYAFLKSTGFSQVNMQVQSATATTLTVNYNHANVASEAQTGVQVYPFAAPTVVSKNLFELKNNSRALVDGNIFSTTWQGGQSWLATFTTRIGSTAANSQGNISSRLENVLYSNNIAWNIAAGPGQGETDDRCFLIPTPLTNSNENSADCAAGVGYGGHFTNSKFVNLLMVMNQKLNGSGYPAVGGFNNGASSGGGYMGGYATGTGTTNMDATQHDQIWQHVTQIMNPDPIVTAAGMEMLAMGTNQSANGYGLGCNSPKPTGGSENFWIWDNVYVGGPPIFTICGPTSGPGVLWTGFLYPQTPACPAGGAKDANTRFAGNALGQTTFSYPGCSPYTNFTQTSPSFTFVGPPVGQINGLTANAGWGGNATISGAAAITGHDGITNGVYVPSLNSATANDITGQTSCTTVPPSITTNPTLPNGAVGESNYSVTFAATCGVPPYTWAVTSGGIPGLSLNTSTGVLSGTPTSSGTSTITIQATDSTGGTPLQSPPTLFTATINSRLAVATTSTPSGVVGTPYSYTLSQTGGLPSYNWFLIGGQLLPPGLSLDLLSGAISGTPTMAGTANYQVQVKDQCTSGTCVGITNCTGVNSPACANLSTTIYTSVQVTTTSLPPGTVGVAYSATLHATGGTGTYTWSYTGTLCAGLTLHSTGVIDGTPTTAQNCSFTVTATDTSSGLFGTAPLSINVTASTLAVTTTTCPDGAIGQPGYNCPLVATGGSTPYTWDIAGGSLPPGLSISGQFIIGTPTAIGTFSFTPRVTDSLGSTATSTNPVTITIDPITGSQIGVGVAAGKNVVVR